MYNSEIGLTPRLLDKGVADFGAYCSIKGASGSTHRSPFFLACYFLAHVAAFACIQNGRPLASRKFRVNESWVSRKHQEKAHRLRDLDEGRVYVRVHSRSPSPLPRAAAARAAVPAPAARMPRAPQTLSLPRGGALQQPRRGGAARKVLQFEL